MSDAGENKSLTWMISVLMLAILALGWAFAASAYATANDTYLPDGVPAGSAGYRRGRGRFISNAFEQLPNAPQVLSYTLSSARWVLYVTGGLEVGAVLLGVVGWQLQRRFDAMDNKYKKKNRRK